MDSNQVIVLNAPGINGYAGRERSSGASHGPCFSPVLPERGGGHSNRVCAYTTVVDCSELNRRIAKLRIFILFCFAMTDRYYALFLFVSYSLCYYI